MFKDYIDCATFDQAISSDVFEYMRYTSASKKEYFVRCGDMVVEEVNFDNRFSPGADKPEVIVTSIGLGNSRPVLFHDELARSVAAVCNGLVMKAIKG